MSHRILEQIAEVGEFDHTPGTGIAIQLDVEDAVAAGIARLTQEGAHTLLIRRRDNNDEYGIVVLADIAAKVLSPNKSPQRVNLYEVMTKPVLAVDPEMDIRYCARFFNRFGLSTAPVIHNDEVTGVVTYNEIVLKGLLAAVDT